jgi:hypothetical protein
VDPFKKRYQTFFKKTAPSSDKIFSKNKGGLKNFQANN